jgi:hypothetical protein
MTEAQVIAACQQFAKRRRRQLGSNIHCQLIDESTFVDIKSSHARELMGKWFVLFEGSGLDAIDDRFYVNDRTGRVNWSNCPTAWWHWIIFVPLYVLIWLPTIFIGIIIVEPCHRFWQTTSCHAARIVEKSYERLCQNNVLLAAKHGISNNDDL